MGIRTFEIKSPEFGIWIAQRWPRLSISEISKPHLRIQFPRSVAILIYQSDKMNARDTSSVLTKFPNMFVFRRPPLLTEIRLGLRRGEDPRGVRGNVQAPRTPAPELSHSRRRASYVQGGRAGNQETTEKTVGVCANQIMV